MYCLKKEEVDVIMINIDDKILLKERLMEQYKEQIEILEDNVKELRREIILLLKGKGG